MNKKIAFLFPGQGAQYPGMGLDFFQQYPTAKAVFQRADEILGIPFSELIFNGPSEELTQTKNSQLAIFITSIAILRVVQAEYPELSPTVCAGLSLGEYTALVAAEKLEFEEALVLVKERGRLMQEACDAHPSTMHVVLGLELAAVEEVIRDLEDVWIANLNCPGQIVIAGTHAAMERAGQLLNERGARRVMPLEVAGAFHSGLMQQPQDLLQPCIQEVSLKPSACSVVMNTSGDYVEDQNAMRMNMIKQVTRPVRWQKGIEAMVDQGIEVFIEMGPGKSLAGMNKRIGIKQPTLSVEKIEEIDAIGEAVDAAIAQK